MHIMRLLATTICSLMLGRYPEPALGESALASQSTTGDEIGMARELGPATWARCAPYLADSGAKLDELARDRVETFCTMVLPARIRGAAGAAIRPVAIGVPGR